MNLADLNYLCCPQCRGQLSRAESRDDGHQEILEGILNCGGCGATFPIVAGIPRFVAPDNYAASFGMQWQRYRRTQLDSHTRLPISKDRLQVATAWPANLTGECILEAGSGAGRFTERLLETGAKVVTFDYSAAVDANRANNGAHPALTIFQGNIFAVPCPENFFDRVLCLGVLQHTPDPRAAFLSLTRYVKPGGFLAVDVYARRITALLHWKYLLRPITKRLTRDRLHKLVATAVDMLFPAALWLRKRVGRAGARLLPIVEYSELNLPRDLHKEWSVLDTFDMYSPAHDHPQSIQSLTAWFRAAGFTDVEVFNGPNGVVGRGRKPLQKG
jgi:SAM-dependent methyltransferase